MGLQLILIATLAVAVMADEAPLYPPPPPPPPAYGPKEPEYPDVPPSYSYQYGVADGYSGNNYGHTESRDGYKTEGSYTVDLPDGRKQIVKYFDSGDGLMAEIVYEGEAQYPPSPSYPAPAPSYPDPAPAPSAYPERK